MNENKPMNEKEIKDTVDTANGAIEGLTFLRENNGKYKLLANTRNDGTISITLNEVLMAEGHSSIISPLFELNLGDVYAQCAPSEIINRLHNDITDKYDFIQRVRDASREAMPEIALVSAQQDTPF